MEKHWVLFYPDPGGGSTLFFDSFSHILVFSFFYHWHLLLYPVGL